MLCAVQARATMTAVIDRDDITRRLRDRAEDLRRLDVIALHLFGSFSRDTSSDASDIDFLVEFDGRATFDRYMNVKHFLEDILERRIDLVTRKALRPELKSHIEREAIRVA
jgi:uncharacterized protein